MCNMILEDFILNVFIKLNLGIEGVSYLKRFFIMKNIFLME